MLIWWEPYLQLMLMASQLRWLQWFLGDIFQTASDRTCVSVLESGSVSRWESWLKALENGLGFHSPLLCYHWLFSASYPCCISLFSMFLLLPCPADLAFSVFAFLFPRLFLSKVMMRCWRDSVYLVPRHSGRTESLWNILKKIPLYLSLLL